MSGPRRHLTLALQGGGSHGAFTWGVLDRLLEDPRIRITALSGTSAGAMNAAVLADGLQKGGENAAREALETFWRTVSRQGAFSPYSGASLGQPGNPWSPVTLGLEAMARLFSPYDLNPLDLNPLRDTLERSIEFDRLRRCRDVQLFVSATNVLTNQLRVFRGEEITVDVLLASACLPQLHHAVRIGDEYFWDGGFMGNPTLEPLLHGCDASDLVIVQINPTRRDQVPRSAHDIADRLNEITFNASLMREIRHIAYLNRLVEEGHADPAFLSRVHLHQIAAEEITRGLGLRSKYDTSWNLIERLYEAGRARTEAWLGESFDALGERSTLRLSDWAPAYSACP